MSVHFVGKVRRSSLRETIGENSVQDMMFRIKLAEGSTRAPSWYSAEQQGE
jgi:hypothetical protein